MTCIYVPKALRLWGWMSYRVTSLCANKELPPIIAPFDSQSQQKERCRSEGPTACVIRTRWDAAEKESVAESKRCSPCRKPLFLFQVPAVLLYFFLLPSPIVYLHPRLCAFLSLVIIFFLVIIHELLCFCRSFTVRSRGHADLFPRHDRKPYWFDHSAKTYLVPCVVCKNINNHAMLCCGGWLVAWMRPGLSFFGSVIRIWLMGDLRKLVVQQRRMLGENWNVLWVNQTSHFIMCGSVGLCLSVSQECKLKGICGWE